MKNTMKSTLAGLALAAAIGGGALATTALPANAATTDSSTSSTSQSTTQAQPRDESKGGHQANGITETLLTGDTATKVTDAALAANPGATIQRVETDAEGAVYEAHIIKADGTRATVYLDASFTVTSTDAGGPGGGMKG
ncbi:hypothetical protein [Pseudarthrobacter niigatensis]|uniref:Membrane protein YkoI n=1 Tax=Pseudarthrobacter niigatensis TaxID=369935 RepID=A0AAJ1WFF6_9MICC|nr:hypothetical protein [Pseudarthrobacter niigatensis]MDQ0145977.1 putative membrane protein YkoI [Pseudarthrobacter niigatensis]MDQ0266295.1 putative membrane protein YkoI [Pseudarthrobacter niigatensis]